MNQYVNLKFKIAFIWILLAAFGLATHGFAQSEYERALKRAQYLLNNTFSSGEQLDEYGQDKSSYQSAVRLFIDSPNFYDVMLRYHERLFGTGLSVDYLDELQHDDLDNKENKFAEILCRRDSNARMRCFWSSAASGDSSSVCPTSWEQAVKVFWYPGVTAWVCPSVLRACGSNLSQCFVRYSNENDAKNAEFGATEIFDSRFSVVKSLSKQSAGLATMVVMDNYPYTKILEPGLTAMDGAIAHFLRQQHHFDLDKIHISASLKEAAQNINSNATRFQLVYTGNAEEHAGVLSTFGWLRRYEKNRSRANSLYEKLLCRTFTSELPRVFPQDPGSLRTTPGCEGCHATLDPLADFFTPWGEGGELYLSQKPAISSIFSGKSGSSLADLADIIRNDNAFATCAVEHSWEWLMGRKFYRDEADLRAALTRYFVTTTYSFKELVYAIATHPAFVNNTRSDALVGDPLEQPPLGEPPGGNTELPCPNTISFAADIQPKISLCTTCHNSTAVGRQDLSTEAQWEVWAAQAVNMMASGNMPPGQAGPPFSGPVYELKEAVRCWAEQ